MNRNPVLNSPDDITDELIQRIIDNDLDSLTINYEFTRRIKSFGEKDFDKKDFDNWFNAQSRYTLHDFSRVTQKKSELHSSDPEETASKGTRDSHLDDEEAMSLGADIRQTTIPSRKCPPGYCSRQEAAMLAGVSELTIINWVEKGHFPQRKVGNKVYIPKEEFTRHLA